MFARKLFLCGLNLFIEVGMLVLMHTDNSSDIGFHGIETPIPESFFLN